MDHLPAGFRFAGVHCGLKKSSTREDLSLIVSDVPAVAAGVYTQNLVYAAPVEVDRERTPGRDFRVVVVNTGTANACTGQRGLDDAREMTRLAAAAVEARPEQALVMSTGLIGEFLPMNKIQAGIAAAASKLAGSPSAFQAAALGITTTDKYHKVASRRLEIAGHSIHIAGMAKGAGMIGPNMATMLGVIATDANLAVDDAQAALTTAVDRSFNCISVEGHMSTNDTVLLLANGAAGGEILRGDDLAAFRGGLEELCIELAKQIPNDGEGSMHLITIDVEGCASRDDAFRIARTVASSNLVKTAVTGGDPNWGRVVSAAGYAGVAFDPHGMTLWINDTLLYRNAEPVQFDPAAVSQSMKDHRDVAIRLQFREGDASARFWTSDLTVDYVTFNAEYHT